MPGEKGESPQGVSGGMEMKECVWGRVVSAGERNQKKETRKQQRRGWVKTLGYTNQSNVFSCGFWALR